jgi:hypothetical protein
MGITVNEPIVLAEVQNHDFRQLVITRGEFGGLSACVCFLIKDGDGKVISEKQLNYAGDDFNAFWAGFNSGSFLYEELIKGHPGAELPAGIESDFLNQGES